MNRFRSAPAAAAALVVLTASLAGCALNTPSEEKPESGKPSKQVVLATHDSWYVPKPVLRAFTAQTGYVLKVVKNGDAGQLTNKLVLTKGAPIADVVFGIDNTFATRAVEAGVLVDYTSGSLPASAEAYLPADEGAAAQLTPVDWGDVCVNVDDAWFAEHDQQAPATLDDLTDPAYRDLFVTPGATTSSPGFAFLLATIGKYGEDGWADYWTELLGNGAKVVSGWSDAYEVDFSAGGGGGDRPIVVSYNSSPPFTIPKGGDKPTTHALLDTCFRQVEYAGVLEGAKNPEGAKAFIDFMAGREFQEALAENMYVFPVDDQVVLPELWAKWAVPATAPIEVAPADIAANRDDWLREWGDLVSR